MTHNTRAGIDWVFDSTWGPVKMMIGLDAIRRPGSGIKGLYTNSVYIAQMIGDTMPWVPDEFKRLSTHKGESFGKVLAHRARYCRPKDRGGQDELERFRQPDWGGSYDLIKGVLVKPRTLLRAELWDAQTTPLKVAFTGRSGVYVLQDPEMLNRIYVGQANDVAHRAIHGHTNSPYRWRRGWSTADLKTSKMLEKVMHNAVLLHGQAVADKDGTAGGFVFPRGVDGVKFLDDYAQRHFTSMFYNTVGFL